MTASRALTGKGRISEKTAQRIKDIADKHKYRPNLLVKGIRLSNGSRAEEELSGAWPFGHLHDIDTGVGDPPSGEPLRPYRLCIGYGLRRGQMYAVQHLL